MHGGGTRRPLPHSELTKRQVKKSVPLDLIFPKSLEFDLSHAAGNARVHVQEVSE